MNWKRIDNSGTRWTWEADEERHLLFFDTVSGELREFHEQPDGPATVHVYAGGASTDEGQPLNGARHVRTVELSPEDAEHLRTLNDTKLFEYLEIGKAW